MNTSTKIQLTELYWERHPLLVLKTPEPWTPGRTVNGHTLADGQEWHRTDGWTKEMLPAGTRPILGFPTPDLGTIESSLDGVNWWPQFTQEVLTKHVTENPHAFWRTTRPLPSVAKPITPEKWAAEKAAFATGKTLEVHVKGKPSTAWFRCTDPEWLDENEYRIKPEPVLVALGPEDVMPGSALRSEGNTVSGRLILAWGYWGVRTHDHIRLTYETLKDDKWLINRNDGRGFVACSKPADAKEAEMSDTPETDAIRFSSNPRQYYDLANRLQRERDELRAEVARLKAACEKEFASVEKLDLECSQLKADKARLDWLERGDQFTRVFRDGKVICERHYGHGQGIRVAIDAAMKGAE